MIIGSIKVLENVSVSLPRYVNALLVHSAQVSSTGFVQSIRTRALLSASVSDVADTAGYRSTSQR